MKVRVYAVVVKGCYGFGLTPMAAEHACVSAGGRRADIRKSRMIRLPAGVEECSVDGFGYVTWRGNNTAQDVLYYSRSEGWRVRKEDGSYEFWNKE